MLKMREQIQVDNGPVQLGDFAQTVFGESLPPQLLILDSLFFFTSSIASFLVKRLSPSHILLLWIPGTLLYTASLISYAKTGKNSLIPVKYADLNEGETVWVSGTIVPSTTNISLDGVPPSVYTRISKQQKIRPEDQDQITLFLNRNDTSIWEETGCKNLRSQFSITDESQKTIKVLVNADTKLTNLEASTIEAENKRAVISFLPSNANVIVRGKIRGKEITCPQEVFYGDTTQLRFRENIRPAALSAAALLFLFAYTISIIGSFF